MRHGDYDEDELERHLQSRGLMSRLFGRWMAKVHAEWHMYPIGMMFGLGFDTATEVALLATTALLASQALPFYAILCLPILFTAGMTLMDTVDGLFMNFAYSWAFLNPVRKVYYNVAITGLSVSICLLIGTIELLGLLPRAARRVAWRILELRDELQSQSGRVCHRGAVRAVLAGRAGVLADRSRGGEMGRVLARKSHGRRRRKRPRIARRRDRARWL